MSCFFFHSYRMDEPEELAELQKAEWDPIIEWAKDRYCLFFKIIEEDQYLQTTSCYMRFKILFMCFMTCVFFIKM